MDIEELRDLTTEAERHGIKHKVERIGTEGQEFEYKINFGGNLVFTKGRAASKFITAIIQEHNLQESPAKYRVAFGWEF